jgi:hypothetical protein
MADREIVDAGDDKRIGELGPPRERAGKPVSERLRNHTEVERVLNLPPKHHHP